MENRISGTTTLLGLIGSPVGHSGSPAMYNYSFQKLNLDYAYLAFDIQINEVKQAIEAIKTLKMRGCNVTMPCKTEVVQYMDELSPAAQIIGAVNTIINDHGHLTGHITDGIGFIDDLKSHDIDIKDKRIVVCGAGGAATAIQVQSALDGAKSITIFNAKDDFYQRALTTVEKIKKVKPDCQISIYDINDQQQLKKEMDQCDIFVNATIVGMKPMDDQSIIKDVTMFHQDLIVYDIVYNPVETQLLKEAKQAGCHCFSGQGMLIWQGAAAFKLYTGQDMPVEEVKKMF